MLPAKPSKMLATDWRKLNTDPGRTATISEWAVTLVCGLPGVQTTILIAAIPWPYSMHGRITRIEASAATAANPGDRVSSLESRLLRLDVESENG